VKLKINSLSSETELRNETSALWNVLRSLPFHIFLIVLLPLFAYSNTLNTPFHFDDDPNIVENQAIKDFGYILNPSKAKGLPKGGGLSSRWVGYLTFAMNYRYNGLDVTGYHIVNILVHISNALLLYAMVVLSYCTPYLKKSLLKESSAYIALFTALLFVSHPVQTQAVTYIVQRFASLATFFYLAAIVCYIKSRLSIRNHWRYFFYMLSLISAILAMKTKEIAFTLPVVITLYEFLFFEGAFKKRFFYLFPLLLTMLIIPISLLGIDKPIGEMIGNVSEVSRIQTDIPRQEYLFTQFVVIVTYIRLLFFPINQNLDYDYPIYHKFFTLKVMLSSLLLLFIFGFGVYMLLRSRTRSRSLRLVAFGIFWFFITLSVESSIIPIVDVIYEHRIYLPSIGVFLAISTTAVLTVKHFKGTKSYLVVLPFFIIIPLLLTIATYKRNMVWKDGISLWSDVVKKSPEKARPHNNLGNDLEKQGRTAEAIEQYLQALRIEPDHVNAHYNLGIALDNQGRTAEAIEQYIIALRIEPNHVNAHYHHNNLGIALDKQGRTAEAIEQYLQALQIHPDYGEAHNNLGIALIRKGDIEGAIIHFRKALRINPDNIQAKNNLNSALMIQQKKR